jgi:hypothetical protein
MAYTPNFCEAMLTHLRNIELEQTPQDKITQVGFIDMLMKQNSPRVIDKAFMNGHKRVVRIAYLQRGVENFVSSDDTCDIDVVPAYQETLADVTGFKKLAILINDSDIRQYCEDASATVMVGQPPTKLMQEHLTNILAQLNGMYQAIDGDLLTTMALNFGKNQRTGLSSSTSLNISKDAQIQGLTQGVGQILNDFQDNELVGQPMVVGTGLFRNWWNQQRVTGINQSGIDTSKFVNDFEFFYDPKTVSKLGTNQIGVFAPNAVQFINYPFYVDGFSGQRGLSFFGEFVDPRMPSMGLDFQFKFLDCPTQVLNGYSGQTITVDRGWVLIFSKRYGLFTTPTNAYDGNDRLAGTNGALRYTITNSCDTCS